MTDQISFKELSEEKCEFSIISVSHLASLQQEVENRINNNQFDKEFAQKYLFTFEYAPPDKLQNAKSLIVVAMPRPPTKGIFTWNGRRQSFILPPTYTAYDEKRLHVERLVAQAVGKKGYKIATPILPLKLLAVHSGLARYGRNNVTYVRGMGSFLRLTAVYSDMPCENDSWQEAQAMGCCADCDLCQKACPTGAISSDRFLLHAEKCLTYHNEKESKIPFPEWIKPEWHNCIVGCIRCQAVCPENQPFLNTFGETAEFDEKETRMLLEGVPPEKLPTETRSKMKTLSLTDYYAELPRNLRALLRI